MKFTVGQGVIGKVRFVDGNMPEYDRTYLVICATDNYIEVLNVSSIKGKERKLAFRTNARLLKYNPPFSKPSFVKLDSLVRVNKEHWDDLRILNEGNSIAQEELDRVLALIGREK